VVAGGILTFVGMIGICAIGLWERGRARA